MQSAINCDSFWMQSFGTPPNSSLANAKIYVLLYSSCFVLFCLYLEGWFIGGYFALRVWGAYTWRWCTFIQDFSDIKLNETYLQHMLLGSTSVENTPRICSFLTTCFQIGFTTTLVESIPGKCWLVIRSNNFINASTTSWFAVRQEFPCKWSTFKLTVTSFGSQLPSSGSCN